MSQKPTTETDVDALKKPAYKNSRLELMTLGKEQRTILVLIFCVGFQELSHLTRNLSQAEKKINVVTG